MQQLLEDIKLQKITRKVDPDKVTGKYYQQIRNDIKRKIKPDTECLIIEIIFTKYNTHDFITESFMYLQRELTPLITIPKNSCVLSEQSLQEFELVFNCTIFRNS
ncbi:hypothetical protein [Methanosarcina sp. UBA289]|uniref:hypothetical protein n=1 Tax=Methanosarcina sp. UBA289 TaxID=1915574 RepID=UPI0025DA9779|nr:hypothetical protein [Methanosarcina sp. UBA289]